MITQGEVLDIARDAIYNIILTSAPLLLISLIVGLIISIFQTVTSIQEQTLTFVPKILGVFAGMLLFGAWMLNNICLLYTSIEAGGLQNQVEVDFNAEYVKLTLNGAILFDSAKANIREDAQPLIAKIGTILENYDSNVIEIEGHTDNVPIHSSKYENNNVLSMYRALSVADFIRDNTTSVSYTHLDVYKRQMKDHGNTMDVTA